MSLSQHPDPSRPRGRVKKWLAKVIRSILGESAYPDTGSPTPNIGATVTVNRTTSLSFTTPAKGDAYDFSVTAELCSCATGQLTQESLNTKIDERLADLSAEIKAAARPAAREFPPFRPGPAELEITGQAQKAVDIALAGVPDSDGAVVSCTVRFRVEMDPELRQMQRHAVADQVQSEARFELSEQAAQRLGDLRDVWRKFIDDGLPYWETPYAVSMGLQPHQTAKLLFGMRDDRRKEAASLVDTVTAVAAGHERMDLLEFALASDRALSMTYELLGIARPAEGATSMFSNGETDEGNESP